MKNDSNTSDHVIISEYVELKSIFANVRKELIYNGYLENGELIYALDNKYKDLFTEIENIVFKGSGKDEFQKIRDKLNDEMQQLDELLKKLKDYRYYINGLSDGL